MATVGLYSDHPNTRHSCSSLNEARSSKWHN